MQCTFLKRYRNKSLQRKCNFTLQAHLKRQWTLAYCRGLCVHLRAKSQVSFSSFILWRTLLTCSDCFFSSSTSLSCKAVHLSFSFFFLFGGYITDFWIKGINWKSRLEHIKINKVNLHTAYVGLLLITNVDAKGWCAFWPSITWPLKNVLQRKWISVTGPLPCLRFLFYSFFFFCRLTHLTFC